MKQTALAATHHGREVATVLILVAVGALACPRDRGRRQERCLPCRLGAWRNASCTPPASASTRAGFVTWAMRLQYRNLPSKARLYDFSPGSGDSVRVEITSAARGRRELARGCVIGRIVATYRDSAFGFIDGTTYIWADSSSPNSVHLVPGDGTTEMIGYNLTTAPITNEEQPPLAPAGTPAEAHLRAVRANGLVRVST